MKSGNGQLSRGRQRGVALFIGLVFLVVLSLVAIIAMKGTLLEVRMVNNVASHEKAFEVSDALRGVPVALFDDHTFNRGWPQGSIAGGTVTPQDFGTFPNCNASATAIGTNGISCSLLKKTAVRSTSGSSAPVNLYQITISPTENMYDPLSWTKINSGVPDMKVTVCSDGSDASCSQQESTSIWIRPDGSTIQEGAGAAQAAGYRGFGSGAASGGSSMFFEILSIGSSGSGRAVTVSQYQQMIAH